jgi:transposase
MAAHKNPHDPTPSTVPAYPPTLGPRFVGVDLHKRIAEYHIIDARGVSIRRGKFVVTAESIVRFASEHLNNTDRVAVEATSNTWAFVGLIRDRVAALVVSNPLKTRAIAEANIKTDKVDALVLAQLLRADFLPAVWLPGPAVELSRALAARRTSLVGSRTAIRNRIHSALASRLIVEPAAEPFSARWLDWLGSISLDAPGQAAVEGDLRLLRSLQAEIAAIEHMIDVDAFADDRVLLLMTLPGVNCKIAHAVMAALGDVSRFPSPNQAAAYLGLVPRVKQSADKAYSGPITKAGSSQARWMLVQAAQSVGRHPGPLGAFFRKLARRKSRNIAVVATARKLVTIAWHMLKNNEPYRYATPRRTDEKLASLRVRATGQKRQAGPPKGTKPQSKLGAGGSRTIKSLDEVYVRQGVPARRTLSQGERRMIRASGTEIYVASLEHEHVVPRSRGARGPKRGAADD